MNDNSVLIVDNSEESIKILTRLLPIFGYEPIYYAKNGLEAMNIINQKIPSVIIADASLSGFDSFLLSEIIHFVPRYRNTSVILMGADINSDLIEKSMLSGVYAFLEKPVTAENVKKVLGSVKAPTISSLKLSTNTEVILTELSKTTKAMLTLIFGQQGRIIKIEELPLELRKKTWEVVGIIKAEGPTTIEIALGTSKQIAKNLATWQGKKNLDTNNTLGQAEGEFIAAILKRSFTAINNIYPVKASLAHVSFNAELPINPKASESYVIYLRVAMQQAILQKQLTLALIVTITDKQKH